MHLRPTVSSQYENIRAKSYWFGLLGHHNAKAGAAYKGSNDGNWARKRNPNIDQVAGIVNISIEDPATIQRHPTYDVIQHTYLQPCFRDPCDECMYVYIYIDEHMDELCGLIHCDG